MSENNENFEDLKKLLKLKQYEIPPPGYFNNFADSVVSRIRAGEGSGQSLFERIQADSGFWGNLFFIFQRKPGLIGGLATSACLLALFGVILLDHSESGMAAADTVAAEASPSAPDVSPTLASAISLQPADSGGIEVTTNPVASLQPVTSFAGSSANPLFQPVGFMPASQ
jgi:hypothetical protein